MLSRKAPREQFEELKKIETVYFVKIKKRERRSRMIKVLFVCLGNICRSPMGEFILKDLVKKEGIKAQFEIASCGTSSEELGNPVYYLAKEKLIEHGISCENKVARKITKEDIEYYDYILTMETSNRKAIERIYGKSEKI